MRRCLSWTGSFLNRPIAISHGISRRKRGPTALFKPNSEVLDVLEIGLDYRVGRRQFQHWLFVWYQPLPRPSTRSRKRHVPHGSSLVFSRAAGSPKDKAGAMWYMSRQGPTFHRLWWATRPWEQTRMSVLLRLRHSRRPVHFPQSLLVFPEQRLDALELTFDRRAIVRVPGEIE